jgi:DNA-binding transcriptional ArsR family regulator
MTTARERIVAVLLEEYDRLTGERNEVLDLLDLLDANPETPGPEPEAEPEAELAVETERRLSATERMKEIAATNRRAVIGVLESGNKLTASQISLKTGIPRGTLGKHLAELTGNGRLARELAPRQNGQTGRDSYHYWLLVAEPVEHHLDIKTNVVVD